MTRVSGRVNGEPTSEGGPRVVVPEEGESIGDCIVEFIDGRMEGIARPFVSGEREVDTRIADLMVCGFSSANPGKYPLYK